MDRTRQQELAKQFRALHETGTFVVPNAWDAGSARIIERAGAAAIATSSAGVSWALGRPDGQNIAREDQRAVVSRIVATVGVPVSADVEGGYGPDPQAVELTVREIIAAGAVGINLEDSLAYGVPLFTVEEQAARIAAARAAAASEDVADLVINARTDVYLFGIAEPGLTPLENVLRRSAAYAEAGADVLFVPGLTDLDVIAELVRDSPLPINIMVGAGAPSVAELSAIGVRRVSLGSSLAEATYLFVQRAAQEALQAGTYSLLEDAFADVNGAFSPR